MSDQLTAKDLMRGTYLRFGSAHTLRETLGVLLDPAGAPRERPALVAVNPDGKYVGRITAREFIRALESTDIEDVDPLDRTLGDCGGGMELTVRPDTTLGELARHAFDHPEEDFFVVLDNQQVAGIVDVTDVFRAVADVVLTPDSAGIRLPG